MKDIHFERKSVLTGGIKSLEVFLGIVLLGMGSTLGIIADIGQTTAVSTSSALAGALDIKVGTAMFLEYVLFIMLQIIILGRPIKILCLLQLIPSFVKTGVLNFFKYDFWLFQLLEPDNYGERLLLFAIGMVFNSLGFTATKCSNFINYPPESFCAVVSDKTKIRFGTCKMYLDFVYVMSTIIICLLSGQNLGIVREGTILFALVNGNLINLFTPHVQKAFRSIEKALHIIPSHEAN